MATRGRKKDMVKQKIYEEKFRKYLIRKEKQIKKLVNES
jgi:hypothetical protein